MRPVRIAPVPLLWYGAGPGLSSRAHSLVGCSRNTALCATLKAIRDEGYMRNVTSLISHNSQKRVWLYSEGNNS